MNQTLAEQARTAVARARVGTLTTYGRRAATRPLSTVVCVVGDGASLVVHLRPDCPATADLIARPLATVQVGPPGLSPVVLKGGVARLPGRDDQGRLAFRVDPGAVRVGVRPCPVSDYLLAQVDPLADIAPAVLAHLAGNHPHDLRACLRAAGHPTAQHVDPTGLDRYGMSLVALCDDGVAQVRLDFPQAVQSLDELPAGLRALLTCRCGPEPRSGAR